ncbi:MAG: UMP kinase [Candidatus Anammoxibacter sp.]
MLKRILLKISGEGFCGDTGFGIDKMAVEYFANTIKDIVRHGVEVAVVVGGGNIVRGKQLETLGISRAKADNVGMVSTLINALVLQDGLERLEVDAKVLSTFYIYQIVDKYILSECVEHLRNKRVVILSGGTGIPHFTTDTAAALRAIEIKADRLLKATKVDGVYSGDPQVDKSAKKFDRLTYMDVLNKNLKVMDSTAITLCMDNNMPIIVFDMKEPQNFQDIIKGKVVGTYIGSTENAC